MDEDSTSQKKTIESTIQENEKDIYLIVLIPKETENKKTENPNEISFTSDIVPKIYYEKDIKTGKETSLEHKVLLLKVDCEKRKENPYIIEYLIGNDIYTIKFEVKKNSFVYDINLEKGDYYIDNIFNVVIHQDNIIPLYNKLDLFLEALQKNNENNKIEKLYEEAIELYKQKKEFNFLIFLFLRFYEDKNLCQKLLPKLLDAFNEVKGIENPKVDINFANLETFNKIYSNKEFIETNNYDPITFYGIIICYLYYYDENNNYFSKLIKELYKENYKVVYEILIMFNSHFLKPIYQDLEFYQNFIKYIIENKDIKIFRKSLNYLKDIETFVSVINCQKEKILEYFKDIEPITIKSELKLIPRKG